MSDFKEREPERYEQIADSLRRPIRLSRNDLMIINEMMFEYAETHRIEGDAQNLQSRIQKALSEFQ